MMMVSEQMMVFADWAVEAYCTIAYLLAWPKEYFSSHPIVPEFFFAFVPKFQPQTFPKKYI